MAAEIKQDILSILETRVRQTIDLIDQLRKDKEELESQVEQLQDEVTTLNATIEELQQQNTELRHYREEIEIVKQQQEEERKQFEQERAEVRVRAEAIIRLLNNVDAGTDSDADVVENE